MRSIYVVIFAIVCAVAFDAAFAFDGTTCTTASQGQFLETCADGKTACFSRNNVQCCGCIGTSCTGCSDDAQCIRSPDSASGWECAPISFQEPSVRLQFMRCMLAINDVALYGGANSGSLADEFRASTLNCIRNRFAQVTTPTEELIFSCDLPQSYRDACSPKASMCDAKAFLGNWNSFPQGTLVANVSSQFCMPDECRALLVDSVALRSYFASLHRSAICVNGTTTGGVSEVCDVEVSCGGAVVTTALTTDQALVDKNNNFTIGLIILLVIIAALVAAGLVLIFIRK